MGYTTPEEEARQLAHERIDANIKKIEEFTDEIQNDLNLIGKGFYAEEYQLKIDDCKKYIIKIGKLFRKISNIIR